MTAIFRWSFVAVLNWIICVSTFGQLTEGDIRFAHVGQDSIGNPSHLEPIPAFSEEGYNEAVFRSLIRDSHAELWMVAKPSFTPEYTLILTHDVEFAADDDPFGERRYQKNEWVLIYRKAKQQIWRFTEAPDGRLTLDIEPTSKVVERRAIIPEESADILIATWKCALLETRYSRRNYRGTDGAIFQFHCGYNLFGETWSPTIGVPSALTKLGHLLIEVVESSKAKRPEILEKAKTLSCEIRSKTLVAKVNAEQDGADQPATAPESKSEDKDKPQPESEAPPR